MNVKKTFSSVLSVLMSLTVLAPLLLLNANLAHADNYTTILKLDFNGYSKNVKTVSAVTGVAFSAYPESIKTADGEYYDGEEVSGKGKSLVINSKVTDNVSIYRSGFNLASKVIFEASVKFSDTIRDRIIFEVKNDTKKANNIYGSAFGAFFIFKSNGTVTVNGQSNLGITYKADTWYNVRAVLDNSTGLGDFFIDGVRMLQNSRLTSSNDDGSNMVSSIKFSQKLNSTNASLQTFGKMYLDDVKLTQINALGTPLETGQKVQDWKVQKYKGEPVFTEDADETINLQPSMKITAAKGAVGSYYKDYPIIPGKNYSFSAFWRGKGLDSSTSYVKAVLTAMKDGQKLQVNGFDLEEETPAATKDSNRFGARTLYHYMAPAGADTVRVQLLFSGPGTAWFNTPLLEQKQEWQDAMGKYSSAEVKHPITNPLNMFGYSAWVNIADENDATLKARLDNANILTMSDTELKEAANVSVHMRAALDDRGDRKSAEENYENGYEAMARRLAMLYSKTQDEIYARKAIIILTEAAKWYKDVPLTGGENFFFKSTAVPANAVYAYDLLYGSPEWTDVQQSLYAGEEIRNVVERWFRTAVMNMFNYYSPGVGSYDNIAPYGINAVFGTAAILNDPDMIRLFIPWIDSILSKQELYADSFWGEATLSYHEQVVNLFANGFRLLQENFKDPADYVDNTYNLKFDPAYNLGSRYPLHAKGLELTKIMRLPNGDPVAINDTHWNKEKKTLVTDINANYLKNIEMYNYGLFSLVQGDETDATFASLVFPQSSEGGPYQSGGHQHANYLNMNLYGSGMEVIPYPGYPIRNSTNNDYAYNQMTAPMHNMPWVWSKNANYGASNYMSTRASMLAYDPGDKNGKSIQLVEASELGPVTDNVSEKRRLLMMVNMDGNRSYTLDLSRLKGGEAHQIFMRAVEDEDTDMEQSLALTSEPDADASAYMTRIGRTEGLPDARKYMTSLKTANGDEDFNFTWKGKESGTSLRAYMNGISGDEVIFSRIPTMRRTNANFKEISKYPGNHFQRRNLVDSSNEVTRYGAVYETWRAEQQPLINNVSWKETDDNRNEMTQVAVVDSKEYIDFIYISDDTQIREYQGISFAGRVAMIRKLKETGEYVQGYVYGEGSITAKGFALQGKSDIQLDVLGTTSAYNGPLGDGTMSTPAPNNALIVKGNESTEDSLVGSWLQTYLGDNSGFGLKINGIEKGTDSDTIQVHDYPPFTVVPGGARGEYYPFTDKFVEGNVRATIIQPSFLHVKAVNVTSIHLEPQDTNGIALINQINGTLQMIASVEPDNASSKTVLWAVYDENGDATDKAIIDAAGLVTAYKDGVVTIVATAKDGSEVKGESKVMIDTKAPVTTDDAKSGWQIGAQTVKLSASDQVSGVGQTFYSVDGGVFTEGTTVVIQSDGEHMLSYYSVDKAGNKEQTKTVVVKIDQTAPTAAVAYSVTTATNQDVVATITPSEPGVTITNNGGSNSYTFYFNGSFTFEFIDAVGNRGTATAVVNNITSKSTAKPGAITLSHDNGWDTGLQDGDYNVITDIWFGDNGKIYKLYENGALIDTKILSDNSPNAQHVVMSIANKPNGTYKYVVELTNAFGTTRSSEMTVVVTQASPGTPKLSADRGGSGLQDGFYKVKMNMDWGVNGNLYKLYENGVLIDTQTLTAHTPGAQSAETTVTYKPNGTYKYVAELSNALGVTTSSELIVNVTQGTPAKAVLSHDNWSGRGSFKVTMNMWSGTNGQTYNLYENGVLIYTQALSENTPSAQTAVAVIANRPKGTYQYRGELVNYAGAVSGDTIHVDVTE